MPSPEDVLVRIGATSTALDAALARTRQNARAAASGIGGDLERLDRRIDGAMDGLARQLRTLRNVFAVVTGTTGLGLLVKRTLDYADSIDKAAQVSGFGIERLQSLRFAAGQAGVEMAGFDDSVRGLNRRLGEFATTGKGPAADAFRQLGIAQDIANGKIRTGEQAFDAILARWADIPTQAQRAALAAKLFGDQAGPKMALLLDQGVDEVARLEDKARALGIVMGRDIVENAVKAKDELATLWQVLKTQLFAGIGQFLGGDGARFVQWLGDMVQLALQARIDLQEQLGIRDRDEIDRLRRRGDAVVAEITDIDRRIRLTQARLESARGPAGAPQAFADELASLRGRREELDRERRQLLLTLRTLRDIRAAGRQAAPDGPAIGPPGPSAELVKFLEKVTKMTGDLRLEADLLARDWPEAFGAVARAARDAGLIETLDGLGALTEDARKAVNAYLGEWNRAQALKDAAKVIAETTTEQEKLTTELARLDELRPWLPVETYDRALTGLLDKMRAANPLLARLTAEHDALAASFRGLNPILEDSLKRYDAWKRELESPFEFADRMRREWQTMEDTLRQAGLDVDPALKARFSFDLDEQVMSRLGERTKDAADGMRDLEQAGRDAAQAIGTAFEDAVLSGQNAADVLKALYMDVSRIGLRLFVTKPLEALAGRVAGQAGSLFGGGGGGGGGIRLFQHGGRARAGETILVGERRPEIIRLDAPATVFPSVAAGMRGGAAGSSQPVVNNYFNITTPDADSFRRAQGNIMAAGFRQAGRESRRRN